MRNAGDRTLLDKMQAFLKSQEVEVKHPPYSFAGNAFCCTNAVILLARSIRAFLKSQEVEVTHTHPHMGNALFINPEPRAE